MELVYWRHPTVPGIKVEEVSEGGMYKDKLWLEMARQLYCENGRDEYREIGHFSNGAPFLYGQPNRISITHCKGLYAVATLAPTPDLDLSEFSEFSALGIDAERVDRNQVLKIREKFLSVEELRDVPADDVAMNVLAWTIKEAAYKALLTPGLDFREEIRIERLPRLAPPVPVFNPGDFGLPADKKTLPESFFGEVTANNVKLKIYSYLSDDFIVTLAYTDKSEVFKRL